MENADMHLHNNLCCNSTVL